MADIKFYAPIEKTDDELRMVYGYASTEAVDSQGEIVKKEALAEALSDYMKWANIREMHQPSAVGKTKEANIDTKGLYIAAKIVDDNAWKKVKEGVYSGFSIGGRVKTQIDNEITGLGLSEISLVDRPANPEAQIEMFKIYDSNEELDKSILDEVDFSKRDFNTKQRKQMASEGKAMPDGSFPIANEEDLHNAIRLWGHAKDPQAAKRHIIARAKEMGLTSALPDSWNVGSKAEEVKDLEKVEEVKEIEKAETEEEEKEEVKEVEEKSTDEKEIEAKEDIKDLKKEEVSTDDEVKNPTEGEVETKDASKEEVKEEVKEEPEEKPKKEVKKPKKVSEEVNDLIKLGKMPSEEQVVALLKDADIEPSEREISNLKYKIADLIVKHIEKNMAKDMDADFAKAEAEKAKAEAGDQKEEVRHEFDRVKILFNKFEKQLTASLKKDDRNAVISAYTPDDVETPPDSEESPKSPATMGSKELPSLIAAVNTIMTTVGRGSLTPDEEKALSDGVSAGSTITGSGHFDDDAQTNQMGDGDNDADDGVVEPMVQQAETAKDLVKMEGFMKKIEELEEKIKKLEEVPLPIKAKASFQVIEKFEESSDLEGKKKDMLKKIDLVAEGLKKNPNDTKLLKEAETLQIEWMKLVRGDNGSDN